MGVLTSKLIVSLIDQVSGPSSKVASALRHLQATADRMRRAPIGGGLAVAMERNQAAVDRARGRLVDAAAGFYALKAAIASPLTKATQFETVLEDIGQKAKIPQEQLAGLGAQLRGIGREVNQAGSEVAKGMDILMGMGAKEDVAKGLLRPIGRAATAYRAAVDDLAKAGYATIDNLKVTVADFPRALDAMAAAGQEGAFELRDMAQYFPSLTAAYQGLKQTGVAAVADLSAALQITRKGAGDSAEAATNLGNVLQKIGSPETTKKFKKLGVNLSKEMEKAAAAGQTPIEAIANIVDKTLKGDLGRLGELFEDSQAQKALRPLIQNMKEYRRIRAEAMKAQGVVEADYERRLKTSGAALMRFRATIENLAISVGAALLPALNRIGDIVIPIVNAVSAWAEAHPTLTAAIVGTTASLVALRVAGIAASFAGLSVVGALLGVARAATLARGAAVGLRIALLATGIGAAVVALAAAGTYLANNWEGVTTAVEAFGKAFMAQIGPAAAILQPLIGAVRDVWNALTGAGKPPNLAAWKAWGEDLGKTAAIAVKRTLRVLDALRTGNFKLALDITIPSTSELGKTIASRLYQNSLLPEVTDLGAKLIAAAAGWGEKISSAVSFDGVTAKITALVAEAGALPGRIIAAVGSINLAAVGEAAIQSLWDGLRARFEALKAWAAGIGSAIRAAIGAPGAIAIPKPAAPGGASGGASGSWAVAPKVDGARARGGPTRRGLSYWVGERGPEIFTPSENGRIADAQTSRRAASGGGTGGSLSGGGARSVTIAPTINVTGGSFNEQTLARLVTEKLQRMAAGNLRGAYGDMEPI